MLWIDTPDAFVKPELEDDKGVIRVMSFNLWHGGEMSKLPLEQTAEAHAYIENGLSHGKIAITLVP